MTPTHIFCDLDDVLADFVPSAARATGVTLDPYPCPGEWDFVGHLGLDPAAFWGRLDYDFWRNLPPCPHFKELTGRLAETGAELFVLTSPASSPGCCEAKLAWVADHWPALRERTILCRAKWALAGPGRVLVDDADHNCRAWQQAGGTAVLFPRPWNALSHLAGPESGPEHALSHPSLAPRRP
jgi:5'(3')-deoxyribonucleotidase